MSDSIGALAGVPAWHGVNPIASSAPALTPPPGEEYAPCDAWKLGRYNIPTKRGGLNLCQGCQRSYCWLTRTWRAAKRRARGRASTVPTPARADQLPRGPGNRLPRCIHCDESYRQGRDSCGGRPQVGCRLRHFEGTKSANNPIVREPYCGRHGENGRMGDFRWQRELVEEAA